MGRRREGRHVSVTVALVVEAPADARTMAVLAEKVAADARAGVALEYVSLDDELRFASAEVPHLTWTSLKRVAQRQGVRLIGFRQRGSKSKPYEDAARKAVALAYLHAPSPSVLVLVVDADTQPERLDGLRAAKVERGEGVRIAVGVPIPKREAWVLNVFRPMTSAEKAAKTRHDKELKLDVCRDAHRLRGGPGEARYAKQVLSELTSGDLERELDALREHESLDALKACGAESGLADFVAELESALGPAVAGDG